MNKGSINDGPLTSVKKNRDLLVETNSSNKTAQGDVAPIKDEEGVGVTLESPASAITFLDNKDVKKPFVS